MMQEKIVVVKSIADKSVFCVGITTEEPDTFKAFTDSASVIEQAVKGHSGEALLNALATEKQFYQGSYFTDRLSMPDTRTCLLIVLTMFTLLEPTAPGFGNEVLTQALIQGLEGNDDALTELLRSSRAKDETFARLVAKRMTEATRISLLREHQSSHSTMMKALICETSDRQALIEIFGDSIFTGNSYNTTLSRLSDIDRPGFITWLKTRALDETLDHDKRIDAAQWTKRLQESTDPEFESALITSIEPILFNNCSLYQHGWNRCLQEHYREAYERWMISTARDPKRPIKERVIALKDRSEEFKKRFCYRRAVREILSSLETARLFDQASQSNEPLPGTAHTLQILDYTLFFEWARAIILSAEHTMEKRGLLLKACFGVTTQADLQDLLEELEISPNANKLMIEEIKTALRYRY